MSQVKAGFRLFVLIFALAFPLLGYAAPQPAVKTAVPTPSLIPTEPTNQCTWEQGGARTLHDYTAGRDLCIGVVRCSDGTTRSAVCWKEFCGTATGCLDGDGPDTLPAPNDDNPTKKGCGWATNPGQPIPGKIDKYCYGPVECCSGKQCTTRLAVCLANADGSCPSGFDCINRPAAPAVSAEY